MLLHLLHDLTPRFDWELHLAHFNHQLRGQASDADERFVRKVAIRLGLPVLVGRGAVKSFAKRKGVSMEMAARELRHKFLAKTARQLNCSVLAVARG